MILEQLGALSTAQALTNGAANSENVIDLGAVANVMLEKAHLVITCAVAEGATGSSSTFTFDLVVATETNLATNRSVMKVVITGVNDPRLDVAERVIADFDVGHQIGRVADATYRYLGIINTLADGNGTASCTVNEDLSPGPARSPDNVQVLRSNVGVPT